MNQPTTPNTGNSIASNADAMIILTQGYPADAVARVVDAHTADQVRAAILADRAQRPTVAGSVEAIWTYECAQPGTDGKVWCEFYSRLKPEERSGVRNINCWQRADHPAPSEIEAAVELPNHPEPEMAWTKSELTAIKQYGEACVRASMKGNNQ